MEIIMNIDDLLNGQYRAHQPGINSDWADVLYQRIIRDESGEMIYSIDIYVGSHRLRSQPGPSDQRFVAQSYFHLPLITDLPGVSIWIEMNVDILTVKQVETAMAKLYATLVKED